MMTQNEFLNTGFSGNMWAMHNGEWRRVASADFQECLFAFSNDDCESLDWVRCENVSKVAYGKVMPLVVVK